MIIVALLDVVTYGFDKPSEISLNLCDVVLDAADFAKVEVVG